MTVLTMGHITYMDTYHPRFRDAFGSGIRVPDHALVRLLDELRQLGPAHWATPEAAASTVEHLAEYCSPGAVALFAWAYLGELSADLLASRHGFYGSLPEWRYRAAVLVAGMGVPVYRPYFSPEVVAAITGMGLRNTAS